MKSHLELKNRVKEYRQNAGMSQAKLAEEVGSSRNTIVSIENGKFCPTAYLAALICIALDCKFEDLFYFDVE
ncbi:MAG: helix-turn-helix transcriptional regulator [Lachnospiraceae bacterium]|nr:helix-turn-helix transcriptional regulator [Candidatus Colinaster scatohippi]